MVQMWTKHSKFTYIWVLGPPIGVFMAFFLSRFPYAKVYGSLDEGAIFPQAVWIDQGFQPYRDFGLGHPPLWYWTMVGLWRIFQISNPWDRFYFAKSMSIFFLASTAVAVYLISAKLYRSRIPGIVAASALFTSWNSFYFGVSATNSYYATMLAVIAIYLCLKEGRMRVFLSSLTLGFALITRHSVALVPPVFLLFILLKSPRSQRIINLTLTLIGLGLPAVLVLATYYPSILSDQGGYVTGVVGLGTGLVSGVGMSPLEKWSIFVRTTNSPMYILGLAGTVYYLLHGVDLNRSFILFCVLALMMPFFAVPTPEPHKLLEAEPLISVVAGATLIPLQLNPVAFTRKKVSPIRMSQLIGSVLALILLATTINWHAEFMRSEVSGHWNPNDPRNAALPSVVQVVKENTAPNDYVLCSVPLVTVLADRRAPLGLFDYNLTSACEQYNVRLILVGPFSEAFPEDFLIYVSQNYRMIYSFPYWGKVFVRR